MTGSSDSHIHEMPQPLGIYAAELFKRATEYLDAAERLLASPGPELSFPLLHLLTHSMELSLKAYLASRGVGKRELKAKAIRHDLSELVLRCEKASLPAIPDLSLYANSLQEMNRDYDFRYPTNYNLRPPPPAQCVAITRALLAAIETPVATANIEATINFASETRHLGTKVRWSD
jgi:hypothetical protein